MSAESPKQDKVAERVKDNMPRHSWALSLTCRQAFGNTITLMQVQFSRRVVRTSALTGH
jgi:hypothetical protein